MDVKRVLVRRKYYFLSTILSFVSGIVIGYSLLGFPVVPNLMTWMGTSVTLTLVVNMLYWTYKEIHQLETEPSFKLENLRVDSSNVDTKEEFKDIYFDIHNKGRGKAQDCRVDVKVKGVQDNFKPLRIAFPSDIVVFNIKPDDHQVFYLCQITKSGLATVLYTAGYSNPVLKKGKIYELELRIFGNNFVDKKLHKLKLDISSWEKIGINLE